MIYHTLDEHANHYTTDEVEQQLLRFNLMYNNN
jgi:hypothetical protein